MPLTAVTVLAQSDTGYIVAAIVVSAVVLIAYLAIVAVRVRDAADRLDALEQRLDRRAVEEVPAESEVSLR